MKSFLKTIAGFTTVLLLAGLLTISCAKKPETIGLDLVDANKPHVGYDTAIDVRIWSEIDDSTSTDETSVSLLGSMYTETFGRTNANFYTHLRLESVNQDWGDNPIADSVIFTMVYSNTYGNLGTEQQLRIYEIKEDMYRDSSYWSNQSFETYDEELANFSFVPNPDDSVTIIEEDDTTKIAAALRIPMSTTFADKIFDIPLDSLATSDIFVSTFKGLYIESEVVNAPGDGSILYFDLMNERSNVTIYYKNDSLDSLNYEFVINTNNARVGNFAHDYTLSTNEAFINQIINGDTTIGQEDLFLQCLGGIKTTIVFPDMVEWANNEKRVINQAKLVIPIHDYPEDYGVSTRLILFENQEDGTFNIMRDEAQGENYFGGNLNEGNLTYSFRVSLHVQDLICGEPDFGLVLFPNAKSVKATEMHLYGTNPLNSNKIQLQITFTDAK